MGPLQVLGMSVVERMYDGQMCLAEFGIPPILFGKFCLVL